MHLGCAFESAEIIMTRDEIPRHQAYDMFFNSTIKLADLFIKVGKRRRAQLVYSLTIARLKQEQHKYSDCRELVEQLSGEIEERSH